MTLWNSGNPFDIGEPLKCADIAEFKGGWVWIVAAVKMDGSVIYTIRTWKGMETPWSESALVTNKKYPDSTWIRIIKSERDDYPQIFIGTERGFDHKWIIPINLDEYPPEPP